MKAHMIMLNEINKGESNMVTTYPRGFKFMTIIDCLAWDLLQILAQSLKQERFDSDHLKLHILMTLSDVSVSMKTIKAEEENLPCSVYKSHSYVKKLLFRDYSAANEAIWHTFHLPKTDKECARSVKIHDESINYLSYVLDRRLTLAQNLKDKPTNAHLLFEIFSRFSTLHTDWKLTTTGRHLEYQSAHEDKSYFRHSAKGLANQLKNLDLDFGEISHRRRKQYGPIWLEVGECVTEVAEELSLFDVFEALPLALDEKFIANANLQKRFIRVIDSLNERYKLLRSCGLKPDVWLERKIPSIAVLRELKKLRFDAEKLLKSGELRVMHQAYRCAFDENRVQKQRKKFANVTSFDEFSTTEYGMSMINFSALSLDQLMGHDSIEENYSLYEAIPDSDLEDGITQSIFDQFDNDLDWIQILIDSKPELFNEVMVVFFQQAIGIHRPLTGDLNDIPLLSDPKFKALIQLDSDYFNLTDDELVEKLIKQAEVIISQGIFSITQDNSSPKLSLVQVHE